MAYTTIQALLKATCDAIREKTSTTSAIKHQEIPEKILSIETGGGGGGGGASVQVFNPLVILNVTTFKQDDIIYNEE